MAKGTVKWFNSQKGYGFIQPQGGGKDVFVHISAVERAGLSGLNEGQIVEYEEVSNKGKTSQITSKFSAEFSLVSPTNRRGFDTFVGFRVRHQCFSPWPSGQLGQRQNSSGIGR